MWVKSLDWKFKVDKVLNWVKKVNSICELKFNIIIVSIKILYKN
jgi:hypothetical protein